MPRKTALAATALGLLLVLGNSSAAQRLKVRGYITARPDENSLAILDDVIHFSNRTQFEFQSNSSGQSLTPRDLAVGMLVEAQGTWSARHQFAAEKITCDASQFDKEIKGEAYLEQEPPSPQKLFSSASAELSADGELLRLSEATKRNWQAGADAQPVSASAGNTPGLVGRLLHYRGIRQADGSIAAREVALGAAPPADAFVMPHGMHVVRGRDPQTGIENLEFREKEKVVSRLKLFPVKAVQDYVSHLGEKLLTGPSVPLRARVIEFRFFVIEDANMNATALPDGTVLVNTGLVAALENEAQLAFVLSHEIAHTLQAHYWREVHETREKRVWITIAAIAASGYIGDLGLFLGQLGLALVINGYSRSVENQADRLGLENVIAHGYDPRPAVRFFRVMVERYGSRSTSALWSNHDSALLRGSFLTVQIDRRYPGDPFAGAVTNTEAFRQMREAVGPVKIL